MMNNKKRPTKEHYDKFAFGNVSSATECTGLITHMPTDEELDAYREVYDYQASPAVSEDGLKEISDGKNTL